MMWGNGWGYSWVGVVSMGLVWFAILAGVVWLVRGLADPPARRHDSARQLLDDRFAAGDISVEDYEARRRVLQ